MKTLYKLRRLILIIIIVIEIVIIVAIIKVFKKQINIKGTYVIKIKRETIFYNPYSNLKFYYENSPNQSVKEEIFWLDQPVTYSINSDALNERFEYQIIKPRSTYRIITLGDSFTYGMFVNTKENWPERLEDLLNSLSCKDYKKFEVINLGMSGYDIQYSKERYRLRGIKYNPDLVLLLLKDDDFTEIGELMRIRESQHTLEMKRNGEFERLKREGIPYPQQIKMSQDMKEIRDAFGEKKFRQVLFFQLNNLASLVKRKLIFITFPYLKNSYKEIMKDVVKTYPDTLYYETVNIYNLKDTAFLPYDAHPNKKGHQMIAEDLYNYLTKNKIIPCN